MTTMTPAPSTVTGGVDTYAGVHVSVAVDHLGGVLGTAEWNRLMGYPGNSPSS
jgi:hypothetical protein